MDRRRRTRDHAVLEDEHVRSALDDVVSLEDQHRVRAGRRAWSRGGTGDEAGPFEEPCLLSPSRKTPLQSSISSSSASPMNQSVPSARFRSKTMSPRAESMLASRLTTTSSATIVSVSPVPSSFTEIETLPEKRTVDSPAGPSTPADALRYSVRSADTIVMVLAEAAAGTGACTP
ncbi:MAG: hypothetical protein MZV70_56840 [Desulfobacterales bacterium]|nr:hypothetical protein [Desulfobacterales bacterium]